MIGTRHIGYFILHTVKPMIEEIDKVIEKCKHLNITGEKLNAMVVKIIKLEIIKSMIYCSTYIIIAFLLSVTCYFILK